MKNLQLITFIFSLLTIASCEVELFSCLKDEGSIETRTISLEEITGFEIGIEADAIVTEGDVQEIKIEAHPNVIDRILDDSKIKGETWEIDIDGCVNIERVKFFFTLPAVKDAKINGEGSITTEGIFKNIDKINLEIDGQGDIDFQLESVEKVDLEIKGQGTIKVTGETVNQSIDVSGSGTIRTEGLSSSSTRVDISGDGDCNISVDDLLKVEVSGSGRVCYLGNPTITNDISGDGQIVDCN